ncbi:hypothetical protein PZA11_002434 [Diplocarpon coronariae]|nr:hypothetical protein JHW43_003503 [Diplocarpon mali]
MEANEYHLACLKSLEDVAILIKNAIENGRMEIAVTQNECLKILLDQLNENLENNEMLEPLTGDGLPFWLGDEKFLTLTKWWFQVQGELSKEFGDIEEAEELWLEKEDSASESGERADYLKHRAGPKVVQRIQAYTADLKGGEKVDSRILEDIGLTMQYLESETPHRFKFEQASVKTLLPHRRDWLMDDVLYALRDHRKTLSMYRNECDGGARTAIMELLHRSAESPDKPVGATALKGMPCSYEDECIVAKLSHILSRFRILQLNLIQQERVEESEILDSDFAYWSNYFTEELTAYRRQVKKEKVAEESVLRAARNLILLAKGKFKKYERPFESKQSHMTVPLDDWQSESSENEDGNQDSKAIQEPYDEIRVEMLAENLKEFCEAVLRNSSRVEIDKTLLEAAKQFTEQATRYPRTHLEQSTGVAVALPPELSSNSERSDANISAQDHSQFFETQPNVKEEVTHSQSCFQDFCDKDDIINQQLVTTTEELIEDAEVTKNTGRKPKEDQ